MWLFSENIGMFPMPFKVLYGQKFPFWRITIRGYSRRCIPCAASSKSLGCTKSVFLTVWWIQLRKRTKRGTRKWDRYKNTHLFSQVICIINKLHHLNMLFKTLIKHHHSCRKKLKKFPNYSTLLARSQFSRRTGEEHICTASFGEFSFSFEQILS